MRLVFMGTPEFAVPVLEGLYAYGHEILGVVTQQDKPKGRGQKLFPTPVKEYALKNNLKVFQPVKVREPEFVELLRSLKPEAIVVAAFGQILPKNILDLPPLGCINVHASLLPGLRGAAPINWALLNGEEKTGITTMLMDEGMDTGPILLQREMKIAPDETAGSLHDKLANLGREVILETLSGLTKRTVAPRTQDNHQATYAPKLKKEDGKINWEKSASELVRLVRGLAPWPGAYTQTNKGVLKIWKALAFDFMLTGSPGEILSVDTEKIYAATGEGALAIYELQLESRRRMTVKEFLLGHEVAKGEQWAD